jgi:Mg2+ and Co2+ transporter CorA
MASLKKNSLYIGCPKNGVLTVHYGVEEITVNVRKMLKKILLDLFADLVVFESGT